MKKLSSANRFYISGSTSGFGYCLFAIGAWQKRALFYLGGIALMVLGTALFKHFKDDEKSRKDEKPNNDIKDGTD